MEITTKMMPGAVLRLNYLRKRLRKMKMQVDFFEPYVLQAYLCASSLQHLSRKAEGNGPMKP
jgi:hypothetical protein